MWECIKLLLFLFHFFSLSLPFPLYHHLVITIFGLRLAGQENAIKIKLSVALFFYSYNTILFFVVVIIAVIVVYIEKKQDLVHVDEFFRKKGTNFFFLIAMFISYYKWGKLSMLTWSKLLVQYSKSRLIINNNNALVMHGYCNTIRKDGFCVVVKLHEKKGKFMEYSKTVPDHQSIGCFTSSPPAVQ